MNLRFYSVKKYCSFNILNDALCFFELSGEAMLTNIEIIQKLWPDLNSKCLKPVVSD